MSPFLHSPRSQCLQTVRRDTSRVWFVGIGGDGVRQWRSVHAPPKWHVPRPRWKRGHVWSSVSSLICKSFFTNGSKSNSLCAQSSSLGGLRCRKLENSDVVAWLGTYSTGKARTLVMLAAGDGGWRWKSALFPPPPFVHDATHIRLGSKTAPVGGGGAVFLGVS